MAKKKILTIGILGFGTVGQGVWKHLENNRDALERRLGVHLRLKSAAVRDLSKTRSIDLPKGALTDDPTSVVEDPEIDILCELMGGTTLARQLTLRALQLGKIVVTANKALLCEHGEELFAAARAGGGHYFFEASVAGGIPIIKVLREGLVANRFNLIYGILNGTSNYILTRMEREGLGFEEIVADARRLGYVEEDEALDLDGWDAAHKAVILAYLAHGKWIPLKKMLVEGIRGISAGDIAYANELGYRIKLLAIITKDFSSNRVFARVHPVLIPRSAMIAHVNDVFNGISLTGDVVGTTLLVGRGAGQDATASSVISDIADAVLLLKGAPPPPISEEDTEAYRQLAAGVRIAGLDQVEGSYYLRIRVVDEPGVLARVADALAGLGISIATMVQHGDPGHGAATLLLTTHRSNEVSMQETMKQLRNLPVVLDEPFLMRIFEPEG